MHQEACTHLDRTINQIKEAGLMTGVAFKSGNTRVDTVLYSRSGGYEFSSCPVNPGFGGQKFIPYTLGKIRELRNLCNEKGLATRIQVDGGISPAKCKGCN